MTDVPTEQKQDLNDQEGDGVINVRDACLKSGSGAKVDNDGCGSETVYKIKRELLVNFKTNSTVVASSYIPEIKMLADFMNKYPQSDVTIEGHTSIRGDKAFNESLSLNRANAIKEILVSEFNIDEVRINTVGLGFSQLLLEGDDEYVHARNRRIVAEISSEERIVDQKWTIYSVDQRTKE